LGAPGTSIKTDADFETWYAAGPPKRVLGQKGKPRAWQFGGIQCFLRLLEGRLAKIDTAMVSGQSAGRTVHLEDLWVHLYQKPWLQCSTPHTIRCSSD
jgi:hypothetical protein